MFLFWLDDYQKEAGPTRGCTGPLLDPLSGVGCPAVGSFRSCVLAPNRYQEQQNSSSKELAWSVTKICFQGPEQAGAAPC